MNTIICTDPLDRPYFFHPAPEMEKDLPDLLTKAGQSKIIRRNKDFHRVLVETIFKRPSQVVYSNEVPSGFERGIGVSLLTLGCTCLRYPSNKLLTQLEKPIKDNDWKVRFWITLGLRSYYEKDEFFDAELEKSVREYAQAMTYPWAYPHRVKSLSLAVR